MALHWLIALCVIAMIPMGLWMSDAINRPDSQQTAYRVFQLHKSIGFTILALTLARLAWRLMHPVPPFPGSMKSWEKFTARAVHAAFYAILILMPLSGWIYVSTGWSATTDRPLEVATSYFGFFSIPHLEFVANAPEDARRGVAFGMLGIHSLIAWGTVALFLLHVGAALKHQFVDRDGVMGSMVPWLRPGSVDSANKRSKSFLAVLTGLLAVVVLWFAGWASNQPDAAAIRGSADASEQASKAIDTTIVPGTASEWTIDREDSTIEFSGNHAGKDFTGRFEDWEGHVWFDPEDLAGSRATVLVRTASARTGDATQEGSLEQAEWFDIETFPVARFDATVFRALGGGRYEADGTLTIKQTSLPVRLPFSYISRGESAKVEGELELDRTALGLGMASDPTAEWVSGKIGVTISVSASRK